MSPERAARRATLSLGRQLASRLLPLALLLFSVVAASAPLAILSLRIQELRDQAGATASEVASWVASEARERPEMWKYDTLKLVAQLQGYGAIEDLRKVVVVDKSGRPFDLGGGTRDLYALDGRDTLWGSASVVLDTEHIGEVWVAMSVARARRSALVVLGLFGVLGAVLAGLMYAIPLRVVTTAEASIRALVSRLEDSERALADLNHTLEDKVALRSSELRAKEQHVREISARAIAMQEEERRAIARELHDSVGQALTAIRIHLQLIGSKAGTPEAVLDLAQRTLVLTDATLEEIRRAVQNLGPAILDDVGLAEAVRRYAEDFGERSRVQVAARIDLGDARLPGALESACYRIVQEGLTNIARHARASRVTVELVADAGLTLVIEDDGLGFDPASVRGHGLAGIRERVELLGGDVTIRSAPGRGTRFDIHLPLDETAEG